MLPKIYGSCLCGAVKYQSTQSAVWAHNCHCHRCRRVSGSAFASTLFVEESDFEFSEGAGLLTKYKVPEAETFNHVFCSRCGTTLPFSTLVPGIIGIPMGSLDCEPTLSPQIHIFVASKADWFEITDLLPQHDEGFNAP